MSGCVLVFVEQATKDVAATQPAQVRHAACFGRLGWHRRRVGQAAVRAALAVMLNVASQNASQMLAPTISSWSRHSRRTVPTQRSATALALGACTGVQLTWVPVARRTSSSILVSLASRSRIKNLHATA